jgi:hypothetical protein
MADFLVAALMGWLFVFTGAGWNVLLNDGDTGWHIRTGEWILSQRQVPYRDLFSFTLPNQQWFAWEWGADVIFALLHAWGGLPFLSFSCACLLLASALILFRWMLWRGASILVAFPVLMLSVGASTVHYLARPHVFTLFFLAVSLWLLDSERITPTWRLWLLLPITLLWTNLHGGWPALFVFLAIQIAVHFLSGDRAWRRELLVATAAALLTLANPYGYQLHAHILQYMGSDWIKEAVEEFQSPRFRSENVLQYEVLLLGGVAASWLAARRGVSGRIEALCVLVWAHLSLGAVRHVPIFVLAAAPVFVREATAFLENAFSRAAKSSTTAVFADLDRDLRPKFARNSLWVFVLPLLLWLSSASRWPQDFPADRFPAAAVRAAASELRHARIYARDQWGDYLLYHLWPDTRVFMDGRSDFFGEKLGRQSLQMESSPEAWRMGLSTWNFTHALVAPQSPLGQRLLLDPGWQVVHRDEVSTLFRRALSPSPLSPKGSFFPAQH